MKRVNRLAAMVLAVMAILTLSVVPAFAAIDSEEKAWSAYTTGYYDEGTLRVKVSSDEASWGTLKDKIVTYYVTQHSPKFISEKLTSGVDYQALPSADDPFTKGGFSIGGDTLYLTASAYTKLETLVKTQADGAKAKSGVADIGNQLNLTPDIEGASQTLDGVKDIAGTVIGILVIAVTIGMTLFTALDLCYITMPVFRNKCDDMKQSGQGAMVKTDNRSGETKLRWVTDEAQYAVQTAVSSGTGKSPIMIYLGKRIGAFIAIGIVLFILFTGNISILINIVLNLIGGLMNALAGFGA